MFLCDIQILKSEKNISASKDRIAWTVYMKHSVILQYLIVSKYFLVYFPIVLYASDWNRPVGTLCDMCAISSSLTMNP
jgi:hypothetical protein